MSPLRALVAWGVPLLSVLSLSTISVSSCLPLQIMTDSSLDDGDVARLLVRTIDLLKQVSAAGSLANAM